MQRKNMFRRSARKFESGSFSTKDSVPVRLHVSEMANARCAERSRRGRSLRTVHLTIARAGGSIVARSCQERVGDVAQLVERRNGIAEATGSTPVVSTNLQ